MKFLRRMIEMIAKKLNLPWLKRTALKIYLHSPRRVQIGLAKFGLKKAVQKKMIDVKKTFKATA